jgi:hypothetical protein
MTAADKNLQITEVLSSLETELSKDQNFDQELARKTLVSLSAGIADLQSEMEGLKSNHHLAERVSKLEIRNAELEDALKIKDSAIEKLAIRNSQLEKELKSKDTLRMSQLELLALRNVELEKELSRCSSDGSNEAS